MLTTHTVLRDGVHYAPTVIPGVFIQCDSAKGLEALKSFNLVYSKFKPSGKILADIQEAKRLNSNLYYNA